MPFETALPLTTIIPYFLGFLVLLIGSYTDFKTREVPDWVNFGLIGIGFGINLLFSIAYWDTSFIINSVVGFGIFFGIAWVMFYTGQWGGGDSKILMGLGAVIGIDFFSKQFFLLHFLVNAMIIGALYGIFWSIFMIFKNRKRFLKAFGKSVRKKKVVFVKKLIFVLFMLLIALAVFNDDKVSKLILFYFAIVLVMTFYLWIAVKSVENSCMLKYVTPLQLTEGEWIAKDVKVNGKYITGPKDLGIEKKNIKKLIEFYKKGKIKKILIKIGIPFVPSFFIAYVLTLIYGNLVSFIL